MKSYMNKSSSEVRSSSSVLTDVTNRVNHSNDTQPIPSFLKALTSYESVNPTNSESNNAADILNETFSRSSGGTLIETTNNRLSEH